MYQIVQGSVFNTSAKCLINPVNTKGVMGAGLALEFRLRYPKMFDVYKQRCAQGRLQVGQVDFYRDDYCCVVNFPTKDDWSEKSKLQWISQGLDDFLKKYKGWDVNSFAFPKLGCDLGGLDWNDVEAVMQIKLKDVRKESFFVCLDSAEPDGAEKKMLELFFEQNPAYKTKMKSFRDLKKLVSSTEYEKAFKHYYFHSGLSPYKTIDQYMSART